MEHVYTAVMPTEVPHVRWRCAECSKHRWLKPYKAKRQKFCSRECHYASMRVENPVRETQARQLARYGEQECPICGVTFEAKRRTQKYCSQQCALDAIHRQRIDVTTEPRPCETCGKEFRPRPGNAGRFCSRPCTHEGMRGSKSANWRGGQHVTGGGYVKVYRPDHQNADNFGYVLEHRLVAEQLVGRPLKSHEQVHHINGDKADNQPENLQVRTLNHGNGAAFQCLDCGSQNVSAVPLGVSEMTEQPLPAGS